MIFDAKHGRLIDNLGWVDGGFLWVHAVATGVTQKIVVGNATYLNLRAGTSDYFMVTCGNEVSVRRISEPGMPLAAVRISDEHSDFTGDLKLWDHFDTSLRIEGEQGAALVYIDAVEQHVQRLDISWYSDCRYDLTWQDLGNCMTLPGGRHVVATVQRSSVLIIIDREENRKVAEVPLAGRNGNPKLSMRGTDDFLASDYDTMCRIETDSMHVVAKAHLQPPPGGTRQFLGGYQLLDVDTLLVARPFSGDVLLVDSRNFSILDKAPIAGQPLVAHRISETEVLARDWKTGEPYVGRLSHRR